MSGLSLKLLGPPEVSRDGAPLRFRSRKELALLLYLAAGGGTHAREKLVELFWPRSGESRGRANLRNALSSLRKTLAGDGPEDPYLKVERYYVSFEPAADVDLDLRTVEAASAPGGPETGERSRSVARLREAVGVHRGEFLEGFYLDDAPGFDHWADSQREVWRRGLGTVYGRLIGLQMEGGEFSAALETAGRWVEKDPAEEAAWRCLIEARAASGDRRGALETYETYRTELERDLGLSPGPEIEALAARLKSGLAGAGPGSGGRTAPDQRPGTEEGPVSLSVPLVGRSEEFGALVGEYHAIREGGGPRGVAVIGESGIGKTRLVGEFLVWAEAQGAEVLRARAFEDADVPYGPILGALREKVAQERAPDDLLDDLWLTELSRLLPEIRERYPDLPPPAGEAASSKAQLFEAIHQLFMALAARAEPEPLILFIDDLQWVDSASLELRQYEWRRWTRDGAPVLVVTTVREEALEFDPEVSRRLANAGRDIPVRRLKLEPLGPEDTTELFGALTEGATNGGKSGSEEFGRWLYEETDGQPFFLVETLEDLLDRGVLALRQRPDGGSAVEVQVPDTGSLEGVIPAGVRDAVKGRLSRLDEPATHLLAAGAVLGRGFSYESLFRVAKLDEDEGLAALDEATSNRLLREAGVEESSITPGSYPTGDQADYVFSHDKIREVVYTEAGEARRRVLHRRVLEVLEQEGAPAAELARHARSAGLPEQAFYHSLAAGDEAMALFAVEDAAQHYEQARTFYEDPRGGRRLRADLGTSEGTRLYERLGYCYRLLFRWTQSLDAYERMLSGAREAGDRAAEWEALNSLAMLGTDYTVQPEEEDELFRGMRRRTGDRGFPDTGTEVETEAEQEFAWLPAYARGRTREALALARRTGRRDLISNSLYAAALLDGWSGHWEGVVEMCAEARQLYAAMGDRALEAEILALSAWGEVMEGRPQEAIRFGREQLAAARELEDRNIILADAHGLVLALLEMGEYEEALSLARRSAEAARSLGAAERLQVSLALLGDAQKALLQLDEARAAYSGLSSLVIFPQYRALAHSKLCAVAALRGDWQEARGRALDAAKLRGEIVLQITAPFHRHREIQALLRGGDEALAREELDRFREPSAATRRLHLAYLRARAVLDRHTGETPAAVERLREAEALAGDIGLPGELWQVASTLGEIHEERGEGEEAGRRFGRAAQTIQTLADGIGDEALRSGFLAATPIRRVLEKVPAR